MSNLVIFAVGSAVFLLLSGGLIFTVLEVRSLDQKQSAKRRLDRP